MIKGAGTARRASGPGASKAEAEKSSVLSIVSRSVVHTWDSSNNMVQVQREAGRAGKTLFLSCRGFHLVPNYITTSSVERTGFLRKHYVKTRLHSIAKRMLALLSSRFPLACVNGGVHVAGKRFLVEGAARTMLSSDQLMTIDHFCEEYRLIKLR